MTTYEIVVTVAFVAVFIWGYHQSGVVLRLRHEQRCDRAELRRAWARIDTLNRDRT